MSYVINGTTLNLQPTAGKWINREPIGFTGNGHPEYAGVREFEIRWQLTDRSDANEVQGLYNQLDVTGTAVVALPGYKGAAWTFVNYSGCTLGEPTSNEYFEQHETEVVLVIYGIVT